VNGRTNSQRVVVVVYCLCFECGAKRTQLPERALPRVRQAPSACQAVCCLQASTKLARMQTQEVFPACESQRPPTALTACASAFTPRRLHPELTMPRGFMQSLYSEVNSKQSNMTNASNIGQEFTLRPAIPPSLGFHHWRAHHQRLLASFSNQI
jgi:hypothetical protein